MHSKWGNEICIPHSVILGHLECCRNHKDLSIQSYLPEKFRCNLTLHESENFSDSFLHHILESEKFRFSISTRYDLTWGGKCEKLYLRNCREFIAYISL